MSCKAILLHLSSENYHKELTTNCFLSTINKLSSQFRNYLVLTRRFGYSTPSRRRCARARLELLRLHLVWLSCACEPLWEFFLDSVEKDTFMKIWFSLKSSFSLKSTFSLKTNNFRKNWKFMKFQQFTDFHDFSLKTCSRPLFYSVWSLRRNGSFYDLFIFVKNYFSMMKNEKQEK